MIYFIKLLLYAFRFIIRLLLFLPLYITIVLFGGLFGMFFFWILLPENKFKPGISFSFRDFIDEAIYWFKEEIKVFRFQRE